MNEPHSWSLRIATVAGIPIRLHATLLLLVGYILLTTPPTAQTIGFRLALTAAVFFCVILHELGHSLVAQRFGVKVSQITLYPIGGIAQIESQPTPKQEIWITIAGPLVNLVIAAALYPFAESVPFLGQLMVINLVLFVFNLIPAFPMDGGRLLRATIALRRPPEVATRIAARIGQGLAILLGLVGVWFNPWLVVTAFLLYNSAGTEAEQTSAKAVFGELPVHTAMMTDLRHLAPGDTLADAGALLIETAQKEFPVMLGTEIIGVLTRDHLIQGLSEHGREGYVAGSMAREFPVARPDDNLWELASGPLTAPPQVVVVQDDTGRFLGLVTPENVAEALVVLRFAPQAGATG